MDPWSQICGGAGWLCQLVADNQSGHRPTRRRSERRRDYLLSPLDELCEPACPAPPPAELHEQSETLAALYAAVRALPRAERSLVLLLLDGLSYREIGEITGLTENHVGVALTRARKKIAETMKEARHEH